MGLSLPDVAASTLAGVLLGNLTGQLEVDPTADQVGPRLESLDEHALYLACRDYDEDDGRTLVALLAMVLLLRERFGMPRRALQYAKEAQLMAEGGSLRIGMTRFMQLLNQRLKQNPTLAQLTRWLIEDFVIVQHERVATAKLPDDTYRVRRVGDGLRFFAQEVPAVFNDSRFNALSTIVHELGWVSSFREPNRGLTAVGRTLLETGDLPAGALAAACAPFEHGEEAPA
jgi:hypothetical protein